MKIRLKFYNFNTFNTFKYGAECFCGTAYLGTKVIDADCSIPCPGSDTSDCGGTWKIAIYRFDGNEVPSNVLCRQPPTRIFKYISVVFNFSTHKIV